MHPKFLDILRCPESGDPLVLHSRHVNHLGMVMTGMLTAPSGRCYPIVRGVPRFVAAENYAASFGYEWNRWPRVQVEAENQERPMAGHTTRMWERITAAPQEKIQGRTLIDFGCGPGRFIDVVRRKGGIAV